MEFGIFSAMSFIYFTFFHDQICYIINGAMAVFSLICFGVCIAALLWKELNSGLGREYVRDMDRRRYH